MDWWSPTHLVTAGRCWAPGEWLMGSSGLKAAAGRALFRRVKTRRFYRHPAAQDRKCRRQGIRSRPGWTAKQPQILRCGCAAAQDDSQKQPQGPSLRSEMTVKKARVRTDLALADSFRTGGIGRASAAWKWAWICSAVLGGTTAASESRWRRRSSAGCRSARGGAGGCARRRRGWREAPNRRSRSRALAWIGDGEGCDSSRCAGL